MQWLQPMHVMFMQLRAGLPQQQASRPAQLPAKHACNQQPFLQGSSAMQCPSTTVQDRRSLEGRPLIICMLLCTTRALGLNFVPNTAQNKAKCRLTHRESQVCEPACKPWSNRHVEGQAPTLVCTCMVDRVLPVGCSSLASLATPSRWAFPSAALSMASFCPLLPLPKAAGGTTVPSMLPVKRSASWALPEVPSRGGGGDLPSAGLAEGSWGAAGRAVVSPLLEGRREAARGAASATSPATWALEVSALPLPLAVGDTCRCQYKWQQMHTGSKTC